jgi:hypothetical protein
MSVLTLADAKLFLNITVATYDAELQTFIDAAEAAVATRVGPLSTSSVTRRVPGYAWNLHLPLYPATALTSVTPVGSSTALTLADLHLEGDVGAVSYNGGSFFSSLAYDVVYTAGRASVPADLLMKVKLVLKYLWNTQRGTGARPGAAGPDASPPSLNALLDGLFADPDELLPGLA